jgi:hypothetical protein
MIWGNNKKEIEDLQKKVDKNISDIAQLQHDQELLKTNQNSLRGLINRKIGIETKSENNLNSSIFLSPNGTPV